MILFFDRFVLVFGCLVLSVFSTIPDHLEMASQNLLILVRDEYGVKTKSKQDKAWEHAKKFKEKHHMNCTLITVR